MAEKRLISSALTMPFRFHSPAYASTVRLYHNRRTSQIFFLLPSRSERQCACVHVRMYWWGYVIYVLRTVLYNSLPARVLLYILYLEIRIPFHEKTQMTHCSLSLTLMGRDLPATLSFSNIRTYTQVRTPNSMQEDSWPFFRAPIPSRYHVKKRTALPPETKLLSHVDHPKN